jgi:ribosome-interacting GTPase 1
MPTNLPPEYFDAEARYKAAETAEEKITALEELLGTIPKHKGTDHLRADLRRRLSKLKETAQAQKRTGKQVSAFHIDREGAGQVVVIGPTNVGKSALVAALTNATPEAADYPYTTWTPTPGMMPVENVQVQLIDTPPLAGEYVEPELLALVRRADLILLVVDLQSDPIRQLEETVAFLEEHHIVPLYRQDRYPEQQRRLTFLPLLVVVNKDDDERFDEDFEVLAELLGNEWPMLPVSAATGRNLEQLKRAVFDRLEIIRVYSKPPGKAPDFNVPFVLKKGSTVEELAGRVHKDFLERLKTARVWGSAVFDGQMVGRDHVLQDGDVVELRI